MGSPCFLADSNHARMAVSISRSASSLVKPQAEHPSSSSATAIQPESSSLQKILTVYPSGFTPCSWSPLNFSLHILVIKMPSRDPSVNCPDAPKPSGSFILRFPGAFRGTSPSTHSPNQRSCLNALSGLEMLNLHFPVTWIVVLHIKRW